MGGVYLSSVVAMALLAFVTAALLRKLLGRFGFYRQVWHPALFDAALFFLLWAGFSTLILGH
jgi:hypothetical protein